jgi:hypothetical protein
MMGRPEGWNCPIGSRILAQNDAKRKQIMLLQEISNLLARSEPPYLSCDLSGWKPKILDNGNCVGSLIQNLLAI